MQKPDQLVELFGIDLGDRNDTGVSQYSAKTAQGVRNANYLLHIDNCSTVLMSEGPDNWYLPNLGDKGIVLTYCEILKEFHAIL